MVSLVRRGCRMFSVPLQFWRASEIAKREQNCTKPRCKPAGRSQPRPEFLEERCVMSVSSVAAFDTVLAADLGRHHQRGAHVDRLPIVPPTSPTPATTGSRSVDGTENNETNPLWGSAGSDLLRLAPADYADGLSAPAGTDRPSARVISNTIADQADADITSDRNLSAMIYAWGQFLDHDLDLTPNAQPAEPFDIAVPSGD